MPAGKSLKQGALMLDCTKASLGARCRRRPKRIRQGVTLAGVAFVQARLRNHYRPFGMAPLRPPNDIQDRLLLEIERLDHRQDQVRAALAEADILLGIVGDLAEAARVEEADDRRLSREIEHARGSRAGAKAAADLGAAGLRQLADDGGLAALHLAQQPDHGSKPARLVGDGRLRVGVAHRLFVDLKWGASVRQRRCDAGNFTQARACRDQNQYNGSGVHVPCGRRVARNAQHPIPAGLYDGRDRAYGGQAVNRPREGDRQWQLSQSSKANAIAPRSHSGGSSAGPAMRRLRRDCALRGLGGQRFRQWRDTHGRSGVGGTGRDRRDARAGNRGDRDLRSLSRSRQYVPTNAAQRALSLGSGPSMRLRPERLADSDVVLVESENDIVIVDPRERAWPS